MKCLNFLLQFTKSSGKAADVLCREGGGGGGGGVMVVIGLGGGWGGGGEGDYGEISISCKMETGLSSILIRIFKLATESGTQISVIHLVFSYIFPGTRRIVHMCVCLV